jgi:hypothetical protein
MDRARRYVRASGVDDLVKNTCQIVYMKVRLVDRRM